MIAIQDLYTNPTIKYLIGNHLVWEDTPYSQYCYEKVGNLVDTAGQYTTFYAGNEGLAEGQYYITIYNNKYLGNSREEERQNMLLESGKFPGVAENEKAGTYEVERHCYRHSNIDLMGSGLPYKLTKNRRLCNFKRSCIAFFTLQEWILLLFLLPCTL